MDPIVTDDQNVNKMKAFLLETMHESGLDLSIHDFRIEFENGLISEIYYVSDMYSSSNGEMVLSGKGSSVIQIYDYGTTVVELPTDYTDNTTT